jgi:hypothetical protein
MENSDSRFKKLFNNQILKDIKFYNTKENYLALEEDHKWVVQGGVEFIFENNIVSFGWNSEMHLNEMIESDLDALLGEMDVFDIELDLQEEFENLKGKKIEEVSFNWTWYQKLDDDMELTDEKIDIPQEIKVVFEDKTQLQIASILFNLKENHLLNAVFDPQGNILISLNVPLEIKETTDIAKSTDNLEEGESTFKII